MKRGPGRPPMRDGTAKTGVFAIRLSDYERGQIEIAAGLAGKPITQWARDVLLGEALSQKNSGRKT